MHPESAFWKWKLSSPIIDSKGIFFSMQNVNKVVLSQV